jgi:hypothetical protein
MKDERIRRFTDALREMCTERAYMRAEEIRLKSLAETAGEAWQSHKEARQKAERAANYLAEMLVEWGATWEELQAMAKEAGQRATGQPDNFLVCQEVPL